MCLLEENCRELLEIRSPCANPAATPAPALNPPHSAFSLREIDTDYFRRKVTRAVQEAYRALYPVEDGNRPRSREEFQARGQSTLTCPIDGEQSAEAQTALRRIQSRLREMYHLLDLAEIIDENLIAVAGAAVASPESDAATQIMADPRASSQDTNDAVHEVWNLLPFGFNAAPLAA